MKAAELLAEMTAPGDAPAPPLGARTLFRLAWRTWPFIRPVLKHVVTLLVIGAIEGIFR